MFANTTCASNGKGVTGTCGLSVPFSSLLLHAPVSRDGRSFLVYLPGKNGPRRAASGLCVCCQGHRRRAVLTGSGRETCGLARDGPRAESSSQTEKWSLQTRALPPRRFYRRLRVPRMGLRAGAGKNAACMSRNLGQASCGGQARSRPFSWGPLAARTLSRQRSRRARFWFT